MKAHTDFDPHWMYWLHGAVVALGGVFGLLFLMLGALIVYSCTSL